MTVAEKIRKWLEENRASQAQLCDLAHVPTSNMSNILRGSRDITLGVGIRVAKVMNVMLDDLVNEDVGWPMPKRTERPKPLTAAEQKVLDLAHEASRKDYRPAELDTARELLMGRQPPSLGPARPLPPPTPEPPTEDGGHVRRGRR